MKRIIMCILLSMMSPTWASTQAQKGQSTDCPQKIEIRARVGEKSILLVTEGKEHVLFPNGNYVFMLNSSFDLVFSSYNRLAESKTPLFTYVHWSTGRGNKGGKLTIHRGKEAYKCSVKF